ncbi:MAG TPA: tetratricopeptide repeat protein [Terriglobales bacterium]|nr:tetratricopeptide repeat protein [Terriglobales bacterium]
MSQPSLSRLPACLLALAVCVPLLAQAPPQPLTPLSPQARAYAEFELGKWAELQAENKGGPAYVQQALQHYTAAMAAAPQSAYIACQMADLLSRLGRAADATTLAQSVIKDHPASIEAHQTLGTIYLRQLSQARQPISGATMAAAVAEYKTLIQLDPTNPAHLVILGKLYGAQGQPALAEQQFRAALALAPTNIDAIASLIQSLAGQNQLAEAQKEVDALPPVARGAQVYATLGNAYSSQHLYPQAATAFRQAVAAQPDDPSLQGAWAHALMQGGDYPAALAAYQRLQQATPDDGQAALRVAQLQLQMGQFAAASASLSTARSLLGPDNLEVGYAAALLDESQGHDQAALAALHSLVARKSAPATQSIFLVQLSQLQMRTGDDLAAHATLNQLRALGPAYQARAQALDIELYSDQRDFPRALQAARAALHAQPDSRSLRLTYANLLAASGQSQAAVAAVQPLLRATPADWDLYLALGQIQEQAQQFPQALAAAARARQLAPSPADRARAAALAGAIQAKQKDFAAAERSYQQALALDPGSPATLNAYGYMLAQQGIRLPQALGFIRQALARDANNGAYLDSLGWVYFKMNRLPEAVANLERAAKLESHDPAILDHLAQAYDRDGKLQQAASSWQQALANLKLNPTAETDAQRALEIQKKLDAVRTRIAQSAHP